MTLSETFKLIKSDMQARADYDNKTLSAKQVLKFLCFPPIMSLCLYRMQKYCYEKGLTWLAGFLAGLNSVVFTVNIDSKATVGQRCLMIHASLIYIGADTVIGDACVLLHQNTIAAIPFDETLGAPKLGNHVVLGGGAKVMGPVVLGDGVKVAMNSMVNQSFDAGAVLIGVPARNVMRSKQQS